MVQVAGLLQLPLWTEVQFMIGLNETMAAAQPVKFDDAVHVIVGFPGDVKVRSANCPAEKLAF